MISLARLKLMLGITTDADDALLAELLDGAVAIVQTETNRYFSLPTDTIEYRQGYGIKELALLSIPAESISAAEISVTEQEAPGLTVTAIDEAATDGFELRRSPRAARLQRAGGHLWRWGLEYVVQYEHGYDVDGLPKDIEQVIIGLVGIRYLEVQDDTFGLRSETFDNYSYSKFGPSDIAKVNGGSTIIDAWREPVLV